MAANRMHPAAAQSAPSRPPGQARQTGVTLVELMVGLAIGLLVVAVSMGAMMLSRGISGTVSDASGIQQQGSYVLRVIGQQLRQAGSLYLNPSPVPGDVGTDPMTAVIFEIKALGPPGGNDFDQSNTLVGGSDTVTTGFRRYSDMVFIADNAKAGDPSAVPPVSATFGTDYLARNCIGGPGNSKTDERVESIFTFSGNQLLCGGNSAAAQPLARNVAEFQVTYLVQAVAGGTGTTMQYTKGSDMPTDSTDPMWRRVQGVQVCLVLYGNEPVNMPASSSYTDCSGASVDMTTLTGPRKDRMHLLFRNTFQLRSQGLLDAGA